MEERVGGAVLTGSIPRNPRQLHGLDPVRTPHNTASQHPSRDHQRDRNRHRVWVHHRLLNLLPQQQAEAQSDRHGDC